MKKLLGVNLNKIKTSKVGKWCGEHQGLITTGIEVAGYGLSLYFTAKGATKIERLKSVDDLGETWQEQAKNYAVAYGLPAITFVATTAFTGYSNHKYVTNIASLGNALTVAQSQYINYRNQVKEELGEKQEAEIRRKQHESNLNSKGEINEDTIIRTGDGDMLFMDGFTGELFYSSYPAIKSAFVQAMAKANNSFEGVCTVNDLLEFMHRPSYYRSCGELFGWHSFDGPIKGESIPYRTDREFISPKDISGISPQIKEKLSGIAVLEYDPMLLSCVTGSSSSL